MSTQLECHHPSSVLYITPLPTKPNMYTIIMFIANRVLVFGGYWAHLSVFSMWLLWFRINQKTKFKIINSFPNWIPHLSTFFRLTTIYGKRCHSAREYGQSNVLRPVRPSESSFYVSGTVIWKHYRPTLCFRCFIKLIGSNSSFAFSRIPHSKIIPSHSSSFATDENVSGIAKSRIPADQAVSVFPVHTSTFGRTGSYIPCCHIAGSGIPTRCQQAAP